METPLGEARPPARPMVVSGPSGVGRRRVVELVRARAPEVRVPIPATSRPRRPDEVDGVDYTFASRGDLAARRAAGGLLEWAEIGGHLYGTPREPVAAARQEGRAVLLNVDPAGARQLHRAVPEALLVYLAPVRGGAAPEEFDVTIVVGTVARAADELVSLLGSPALL